MKTSTAGIQDSIALLDSLHSVPRLSPAPLDRELCPKPQPLSIAPSDPK